MKWNQILERLFWVFISAAAGTLAGAAVFDLPAWQAAAMAGFAAIANALTQIARWRLSVLPNPGEGLVKP